MSWRSKIHFLFRIPPQSCRHCHSNVTRKLHNFDSKNSFNTWIWKRRKYCGNIFCNLFWQWLIHFRASVIEPDVPLHVGNFKPRLKRILDWNTKKNILRVSYILCSAEINLSLSARGPIYFCTERSDLYEWIQEQIEYLTKHCIAYVKIDHQLIMRRNITIYYGTLLSVSQ